MEKPIFNDSSLGKSAAGGLHKYANPSLIEQEKDAWRKAAVKKHVKLIVENEIPTYLEDIVC